MKTVFQKEFLKELIKLKNKQLKNSIAECMGQV